MPAAMQWAKTAWSAIGGRWVRGLRRALIPSSAKLPSPCRRERKTLPPDLVKKVGLGYSLLQRAAGIRRTFIGSQNYGCQVCFARRYDVHAGTVCGVIFGSKQRRWSANWLGRHRWL
jgi:hypothetical protein